MADQNAFYIGGGWVTPTSKGKIEVVSPHTEEVIDTVPDGRPEDMDAAVVAARRAFEEWGASPFEERLAVVERFAGLYAGRLAEMADVITAEMGSPTSFSQLAQSPAPWLMLNTFIEVAKAYPWEETRAGVLAPDCLRKRARGCKTRSRLRSRGRNRGWLDAICDLRLCRTRSVGQRLRARSSPECFLGGRLRSDAYCTAPLCASPRRRGLSASRRP